MDPGNGAVWLVRAYLAVEAAQACCSSSTLLCPALLAVTEPFFCVLLRCQAAYLSVLKMLPKYYWHYALIINVCQVWVLFHMSRLSIGLAVHFHGLHQWKTTGALIFLFKATVMSMG